MAIYHKKKQKRIWGTKNFPINIFDQPRGSALCGYLHLPYTICYRYIFGVHRRRDRATLQTRVLMFSSSSLLQNKIKTVYLYLSIDVCVCVSLRNRLLLHGTNTRAKNMSFVLSYIRKNRAKTLVKDTVKSEVNVMVCSL